MTRCLTTWYSKRLPTWLLVLLLTFFSTHGLLHSVPLPGLERGGGEAECRISTDPCAGHDHDAASACPLCLACSLHGPVLVPAVDLIWESTAPDLHSIPPTQARDWLRLLSFRPRGPPLLA